MELATASDMVTDYLSAFGMKAEDAAYMADLLTYAQSNANTSAQQLGDAYGNCAANLAAAGQDIETVTALLEAMANQGLKGSEAGTALAAVMRDITNKMEDGKITIGDVAVSVQDTSGNFRDLTDILADVESAVSGLGTAEQAAALSGTFTKNSITGINLVLNEGISAVSGYEEALRSSTGAAADAAATMQDNLTGDLKTLNSALDELKLKIFEDAESPLRNVVQWITEKGIPALEFIVSNIDKIGVVAATATAGILATKAAMALMNAELEITPIGAVLTAGTAVISGLEAIAIAIGTATDNIEVISAKTEDYTAKVRKLQGAMNSQTESAEKEAAQVSQLKNEYDELRQKTVLTTSEQSRLDSVASSLASALGVQTDDLRELSGAYKDLTNDVDNYIKNLKKQALYDVYEEIIGESAVAMSKLEGQIKSAEEKYKTEREKYEEMKDEFERTKDDMSLVEASEYSESLEKQHNKMKQAMADMSDYKEQYINAEEASRNAEDAIRDLTSGLEDESDAASDAADSISDLNIKTDDLRKTVKNTADSLTSLQDEIESTGSISLSTLNTISEKYPELSDLVDDYIAGLKTEEDVLKGLESIYDTDVDNWKKAILTKKNADEDFYETAVKTNADMVNEFKDQYGIDLTNFKSLAEAKKAILESLKNDIAEINNEWGSIFTVTNTNGRQELHIGNDLIAVDNGSGWKTDDDESDDDEYKLFKEDGGRTKSERDALLRDYLDYLAQRDSKNITSSDIDNFVSKYWNPSTITTTGSGSGTTTTTSGSGSSGSGSGSSSKEKKTKTVRYTYKGEEYAESFDYYDGDDTTTLEADARAKAQLGVLDRAKDLGKVTTQEEVNLLKKLVDMENLSYEERYELRKRLYTAEQTLADEAADREKALQDELTERQNLAYAAYKKLVENKKTLLSEEAAAAKAAADEEIAAIEETIAARAREKDDAARQSQLDAVNARLRYDRLTDFERRELLKRKQELLNEQADIDFERQTAAEKAAIQARSDAEQAAYTEAINNLTDTLTTFSDRLAYLQGTQSNDQKVQNNTKTVNIQIIQNGMDGDQVVTKLMNDLGAVL